MNIKYTGLYKAMVLALASGTGAMAMPGAAFAEETNAAKDENIEKIAVVGTGQPPLRHRFSCTAGYYQRG